MTTRGRFVVALLLLAMTNGPRSAHAADGRAVYTAHCARCHGETGKGDGPAHTMQRPWPRDFTKGRFKFRSTPYGSLPAAQDLERVISRGVLRTSMPPYENVLKPEEIRAVSEYVLDLARASGLPEGPALPRPAWLSAAAPMPADIEKGRQVFLKFKCGECHGDDGRGLGKLAGGLKDENGFWTAPSDLTDPLSYGGGSEPADIFLRVMTGIDLSPMLNYSDLMDAESAGFLAQYVRSLQIDPSQRKPVHTEEWRRRLPSAVRGEYFVRAMSCGLCHNSYNPEGMYAPKLYLAGGVGIRIPGLGTYPTRNLTSHPDDGLGRWTEDQIVQAVTAGVAPDRRLEAFAMPWVFFSHLDPQDARDIAAYLKTLPPLANRVPPRKIDPFHVRVWERFKQLIGLSRGRLEYPPLNKGEIRGKGQGARGKEEEGKGQ